MENRIVIIDGNSLLNRAFYAMQRPMITKEGVYTQGIFGFLNMLYKILEDYDPEYMAVAWDVKAPTFRHKAYQDYKAGRRKMPPELAMEFPIVKEILDAMHITNLELEGYEADDIIGTISRQAEEEGLAPLIITGDKDALQLASETTNVLITKKGITEFDLYDDKKMLERYQLTPEQFIDLKGLMGDSSDNIPGIPGVGEKTGIKLLLQFGSIANLLQHTEEITAKKLREKVEEHGQLALMSRKLATINRFVPLDCTMEDLHRSEPDYDALIAIYTRLEFASFLRRLHQDGVEVDAEQDQVSLEDIELVLVDSDDQWKKLQALPERAKVVLKAFGDDNHVTGGYCEGVALMVDRTCYYIPVEDGTKPMLVSLFQEKKFAIIGHSLAQDYYMFLQLGITELTTYFDTKVAAYVLNPSRGKYELEVLALDALHHEMPSWKDFLETAGQGDLFQSTAVSYGPYAVQWCGVVWNLYQQQERQLKEAELRGVCDTIEFPLVRVLADMEWQGVRVDGDMLTEIGDALTANIDDLKNSIYEMAGEEFNINSPAQLGPILFEKLELPAGKKTKRGYSTSADVLNKIKKLHPIVEKILEYRTITKLHSTYVEGLRPLINKKDGKIHAHFQQTVAATGRLSCTEPNLQNIPIRTEEGRQLRKAFTAGENRILVGADYSQIELRILAHLSGDENLIQAFNQGDDIHRMTASRVFGIPYEDVTSLDRSKAKAVNFGVIYGMSSFGLSENLHISRKEAGDYIEGYFAKHPAVKQYMDDQVAFCKAAGYTKTVFGRRRYIQEIGASNFMTRQLGERLAMNSPIQGTAADIIKIAMNKVYGELTERNMKSKLVLQIHDELIIDTTMDELEDVKELLVRNMEEAADLSVTLTCDRNEGATWYALK